MAGFWARRRARKEMERSEKRMNQIVGQYLQMQNPIAQTPVPNKSEEVAEQMQDAWRFMVSQHPTVPTIDNNK